MTLLRRAHLGRVALAVRAIPVVIPVRYKLEDGDLLFAATGDELRRALHGNIIALQADGFEEDTGQRWTVFATGPAERVERIERTALSLWVPPDAAVESDLFRLKPSIVSGRWIGPM